MEFVSENAVPKCMTLDDICQSTNHNSVLQNVIECLESGKRYKFKDDKTMDIFSRNNCQKIVKWIIITS